MLPVENDRCRGFEYLGARTRAAGLPKLGRKCSLEIIMLKMRGIEIPTSILNRILEVNFLRNRSLYLVR